MSGYVPNIPRDVREAELAQSKETRSADPRREFLDAYEQHTAHLSARPAKLQVTLRIGVFFDGTGNNASNTLLGQQCGAHGEVVDEEFSVFCEPYMSDPNSSYGNDVTNVYKLWDLYPEDHEPQVRGERRVAHLRIYVDGIGTRAGQEDGLAGMGLGRGDTGVEARAREAFDRVSAAIVRFAETAPHTSVSSLCFDLFGFSRGAAAARHFANQVALGARGPLRETVIGRNKASFDSMFSGSYGSDVNVAFIGLYDTVAAVAGWSDFGSVKDASNPGVELFLDPGNFPQVVQLVARDEHRANFALNSVGQEHTELVLPGVHSDIGGGYSPIAHEKVLISRMRKVVGHEGFDVAITAVYQQLVAERERLLDEGWPEDELEIVTSAPLRLSSSQKGGLTRPRREQVFVGLQLQRQVRGELSKVYLRVMYQLSRARGVPFNDLYERDAVVAVPSELKSLCERFLAGNYHTTPDEEHLLRRRYIHTSAHWNPLPSLDVYGRTRLLYVHAPTEDRQRVVHPHQPRKALL